MAADLLVTLPRKRKRLYRHDLESFFYILAWAALHYDFSPKIRASRVHWFVELWTEPRDAHEIKNTLFTDPRYNEALIRQIPAYFRDPVTPWICAIWDLFGTAAHHHASHHKPTQRVFPWGLSAHNLMFTLESANRRVQGILSDWDLSARTGSSHHRDTYPFMAADLLAAHPLEHLYRYDLESFFYILFWAALHYDFPKKTRMSQLHPAVELWAAPTISVLKKFL
ncbi:hypothetical protein DXG03_009529 [Asterophora parasitica]|uniref:Fungal-type protein kinase domain-containing protein n=1 Tax=Asterophora parasitica TaxID=117018 RepID=A0A9P7G3V3_9AGAR|nr:hypothetical protein DXG03_009529 [Asterophora parasitica]